MGSAFKLPAMSSGSTLAERVYEAIKEAILDLKLKPGTLLVEDELARQLGTSKTPVRDALLALERDSLVTKIPYTGTYVSEISLKDAKEIFELREVLEGLAARLAARSLSPRDLDAAAKLLDRADEARAASDLDAASDFGAQFHRILHQRADNGRLLPILEKLEEQLRRLRHLSDRVAGRLEKSGHEHRAILEALHTAQPDAAEQAMRRHMQSVLADFTLSSDKVSAQLAEGAEKELAA